MEDREDMKLITFQPLAVLDEIDKYRVYTPPECNIIEKYVYCTKLDEHTAERLFLLAPSFPQILIYLDVDDSKIEEIDSVSWVNKIFLGAKYNKDESKYKEYRISEIRKEEVYKTKIISNSYNEDKVQDDYMNKHFYDIERLSGSKWYRGSDDKILEFWGSHQAMNFVKKVARCIMPLEREVTEAEFDEAIKLINKYFKKKGET